MNVTSSIDYRALQQITNKMQESLVKTADAVKTEVMRSQTMPFDSGALQNRSTFVDDSDASKGEVRIVSDTPYARRLYFHPEFNFSREANPNAGAQWFEPYIHGDKRESVTKIFERFAKL